MKFVYADELKNKFKVYGHFYDLVIGQETFHCRSVLEIIFKDIINPNGNLVDAIVIMMNPGSSKPLSSDFVPQNNGVEDLFCSDWKKELIPTRPDNAQYQIMRLMLLQNWNYIRVINLSDLRNGNSGNFAEDYNRSLIINKYIPHSIFNSQRLNELKNCFSSSSLIVVAWGAENVLIPIAETAMKFLKDFKYVGIPYDNVNPFFRYASPYKKSEKINWLKNINNMIKK